MRKKSAMDLIARATRKQAMISGGYSPGSVRNLSEILEKSRGKKNSAIYLKKFGYLTSMLH